MKKSDGKTHLEEVLRNLDEDIRQRVMELLSDDTIIQSLNEKLTSMREDNDSRDILLFKIGILVKFLFSCLIDADRLSTADFEFTENKAIRNNANYIDWSILSSRLKLYLDKIQQHTAETEGKIIVDQLRKQISEECFQSSFKPKGIYQLTVPTGGGKTLSSLRFSLNHAHTHAMDRIIYIIPYTSIIDQNADVAKRVLEEHDSHGVYASNIVLEHHSNLTPEEESVQQKLLAENWDAPIVFTTMVQFLESMFGHGTRNTRRIHQLTNSVIIFDEIQTLPIRCVHIFSGVIRFLVKNCGSTIVLCTAIQPLLDKISPVSRALPQPMQIISDVQHLFRTLKRVCVSDCCKTGGWTNQEIVQLTETELRETGSVLIIVNTKKSAINLFQLLQEKVGCKLFHLSTGMCPAHRMRILENIRKRLDNGEPIICVSTQLIEAGVDIDFGSVVRFLAGLDSIAQAAGRCNRNGARPQRGRVFIINPQEENLDKLKDIKVGSDIATRILTEYKADPSKFDNDIIGPIAMEQYYRYYFYSRSDEMEYKINRKSIVNREDSLFNLLSCNTVSVPEFQRINKINPPMALPQSFMTASKVFQAIDSSTRGVIVPYEEGIRIIHDLCAANDATKQYKLLKEAQRYSVNVYSEVFRELVNRRVVQEVQEGCGIYYLDEQYYSDMYGLSTSPAKELEFLIY